MRCGVIQVGGEWSKVPKVVWAVLVGNEDQRNGRVVLDGVNAYRGGWVVFFGMLFERLCEGFAASGQHRLVAERCIRRGNATYTRSKCWDSRT